MNRRFGRALRECFEKVVAEPVPASWLELIARIEQREQLQPLASGDSAGHSGSGQSD